MKKMRIASIVMLALSSAGGIVRGYKMMYASSGDTVLFPYAEEAIRVSMFTSYRLLGAVVFILVGIFSLIALLIAWYRKSYYGYLVIIEGIFLSFLGMVHVIFNGIIPANLGQLIFAVAILVLGFLQTPREF